MKEVELVANQKFLIRELRINIKFDSNLDSNQQSIVFYLIKDSQINVDSRINLESNHLKKDSNQLSLSVSPKK